MTETPAPHAEEMARDAARYRWLRDHFDDVYAVNLEGELVVQVKGVGLPGESAETLDAAIDAALAATEGSADV